MTNREPPMRKRVAPSFHVMNEYPDEVPSAPAIILHRGAKKLLISDTDGWIEFQGQAMQTD